MLHLAETSHTTLFSRPMAFTDMNGLANSSKFIRSIKRGQIVMWLIASRALDKVGPSICIFSASIGSIMHDTGLIIFSRITVRTVPVVVVEMDGMSMRCYVGKGKGNEKNPAVYTQLLYLTQWEGKYEYDISTNSVGGNQPHNNLPPVYSVYKFRRVK